MTMTAKNETTATTKKPNFGQIISIPGAGYFILSGNGHKSSKCFATLTEAKAAMIRGTTLSSTRLS